MKTNTNHWRLLSRSTVAGLVLLLVLVGLSPVVEAGSWVRRDWSRVQAVTPGTRTTVLLYKDQAPQGTRKVKGHFQSATPEAITLLLPGGHPYTLQKQAVRKVLVYRPLKKRYQGWVGVAISTAVWAPRIATADDVGGFWGKFLLNRAFRKIRICTWPAMGFPLGARASRPHSCKGAAPAPVGR